VATLIVDQHVSVDGMAEARDGGSAFFEDFEGLPETEQDHYEALKDLQAIVLGANTYRMFAKFWPTAEGSLADLINRTPKHVFSGTLEKAPWGKHAPAIVERDNLRRTVVQLGEKHAGDIVVWGSLQICAALFEEDVVDVLRLWTIPVLVGAGRGVTPPKLDLRKLKLAGSKTYPSGIVAASYAVR
jgi:dihydrofolate reductase